MLFGYYQNYIYINSMYSLHSEDLHKLKFFSFLDITHWTALGLLKNAKCHVTKTAGKTK